MSYRQILKASALIGASSVVVIAIGVIRTKAVAILLGPTGIGLMGVLNSILDLAAGVAGLGLGSSGVRQIAESAADDDRERIARTAGVLVRLSLIAGIAGAIILAAVSNPVARLSFGGSEHWVAIAILGVALLLRVVAAGLGALLQGMRRLRDMALANIVGALLGSIATVGILFAWGQEGIAPSIVAVAACSLLVSWWFVRRAGVQRVHVSRRDFVGEGAAMLKLGVAFLVSGLVMMGVNYLVRILIIQLDGLHGAGLYQAAWGIAGMYVGLILQAMGADFYPRLVGAIGKHDEANRIVNEQAHVSLLLGAPGVVLTILAAPPILALFYTREFSEATELLRWLCLGIGTRIVTYPLGYIIVAKNHKAFFIGAEVLWAVANLGLTWLCMTHFGLNGAGIAFFASYLVHWAIVAPIARHLTGFRWSPQNRRALVLFVVCVGASFLGCELLPLPWALLVGGAALLVASIAAWREIVEHASLDALPSRIGSLVKRLQGRRKRS